MTEGPESGDYSELDLGKILRLIYNKKWLIFGVAVLTGIAAAAYTLTKSNVYESSAALIVREPQSALEQKPDATGATEQPRYLSVETLQLLAESTATVRELFDRLWEEKAVEAWGAPGADREAAFRSLQNALSTSLMKQQNRRSSSAMELLPVLTLTARAGSPEAARIIADRWASIVEKKSTAVYTQGLTASSTFIGGMFENASKELKLLENSLKASKLEAQLALKKSREETVTTKIIMLEDQILELDVELAVNRRAIEEGTRRAAEQQYERQWIGTAAEDALLRGEPYPFTEEELTEQAAKVVDLIEQKVAQREELRSFRREQNMLSKKTQFTHYEADIARILGEKAKVDDDIPGLERGIAALQRQLEEMPEMLVLNKAITDDALWKTYLEEGKAVPETQTPLQSEALNPVYHSTVESIVEMTTELETLRARSAQLEASAQAAEARLIELELDIDQIQQGIDRREQALEATDGLIKLLRDDYLTERNRVDELIVANMRKEEERQIRLEKQAEFETVMGSLELEVADSELEIEQITREVETRKSIRTALAGRAETATLLQVASENAAQTGTGILYQAEANPQKIAPARTKMVLASTVVAVAGAILLLCALEIARPRGKEE
ncbi:MAG: hypothetical protein KF886_01390 [Candidatus Hydrogenedentes bacterium]|nr:hypothetical protein [Candidatus Hydrogenedentota bacterium]